MKSTAGKPKVNSKVERCKCINQVNKRLAKEGFGIRIDEPIVLKGAFAPPMLRTRPIDNIKRRNKTAVTCTFCPFCGRSYGFKPGIDLKPVKVPVLLIDEKENRKTGTITGKARPK